MNLFIKIASIVFFILEGHSAHAQKGTLIEFGWDYPDVSQLNTNLPSMQKTPFDGIVFSLQRKIMDAFDTSLLKPAYFEPDKINHLKWGKYKSNFMWLWGFATSGGSWFDDRAWQNISINMINLSKALASPDIKGVLFDPEYYYEDQLFNPWTYNKKQYPTQSFKELQAEVKKRGSQFIVALQTHKPNLTFLSIWITSLVAVEKKTMPLEETRHALLLSFIEGILEAKHSGVKVIDGNEFAYYYSNPSQFLETKNILKKCLVDLMQTDKAKSEALKVGIAQPLYYDGLLGISPSFNRGFSNAAKWKWVEENTKFAMAATDDITWFYSERVNWWKGAVNDKLFDILANNKKAQATNLPIKSNITIADKLQARTLNVNMGEGYYYLYDTAKPMKTGNLAFNYRFNKSVKELSIKFINQLPDSVSIFLNNTLFATVIPNTLLTSISLDDFKKGKLVVLAKYAGGTEASAIEIYK